MTTAEQTRTASRLLTELAVGEGAGHDLDALLERLFSVLKAYPELSPTSGGAIVLLNARGEYRQVAQCGIGDPAAEPSVWEGGAFASRHVSRECQVQQVGLRRGAEFRSLNVLLLPLCDETEGLGYVAICVSPAFRLDSVHDGLFETLALLLSALLRRIMLEEALQVRELELVEAHSDALHKLSLASEYRDNQTGWHLMRMSSYAITIARTMGVPSDQRELLYVAAPMHDVGKIGIPDALLLKSGKLTDEEFDVMKRHTEIGASLLSGSDVLIKCARDIALYHHERWDGSGYPKGMRGEEIPILARICAVADVFDALTSERPYKQAWTVNSAYDWILSEAGRHFDPAVVSAFGQAFPEILRIRELYRDEIIDPKQELSLPPLKAREKTVIPWDESLGIGIDVIDEHHRYLFLLINDLYGVIADRQGAREVVRVVRSLEAYAKVHFLAEEKMMRSYGYAEIDEHIRQHRAFEQSMTAFYEEMHSNPLVARVDVFSYVCQWLTQHIRKEDTKLSRLVAEARPGA